MNMQTRYFRSGKALPEYRLDIRMATGAHIEFDFASRLNTMRFGVLKDEKLFATAFTDGESLLFGKDGPAKVSISATDFMDLVLVDKTGDFPGA
ncbi:MAG: hypothetical protein GX791_06345 [Synergistaceae bacterium]|nr:hypothetical protein [Synergistaceae bacterium]